MRTPNDPASEFPLDGLESYYQEFRQTRIDELAVMNKALQSNNYQILTEMAHKWKGYAAPYGFGLLGQIAVDLELKAETKEYESCFDLLLEADSYLQIQKKRDDSN